MINVKWKFQFLRAIFISCKPKAKSPKPESKILYCLQPEAYGLKLFFNTSLNFDDHPPSKTRTLPIQSIFTLKRILMKCRISAAIAMLFLIALSVVSCKKDNNSQTPVSDAEAQTISQEDAAAENEYDDVTEMGLATGADMESGAIDNGRIATDGSTARIRIDLFVNLALKLGAGVTITAEPNDSTFPKTVTINYGDGILCRDGRTRKGSVVLYFSAPLRRAGAQVKITLKDYYVNRAHIEGVKTITNVSANGAVKYSVKIESGEVTRPNGRGFTYEGTKTVTQIQGASTTTCGDDVYSIEVNTVIKYANGITVTKTSETPLVKAVSCHWIAQGILKININDRVMRVDFGTTGDCDNKALLISAKGQVEITL
jgi:hypothetical protein